MNPVRPKFSDPPLIERAITISFEPIEDFTIGHYGLFWQEILADFPISETQPLVRSEVEKFGGFQPTTTIIQLLPEDTLPRAFFRNPDRGELIQLQSDRFSFNWIKAGDNDVYPHSEATIDQFEQLLNRFEAFLARYKLGPIATIQCEITNVNVIPVSDFGGSFAAPGAVKIPAVFSDETFLRPESAALATRHLILADDGAAIGRVHMNAQPSLRISDGEEVYRLDITARGAPLAPDRNGTLAFLEIAVSAVNAVFLATVTDNARQLWGEQHGH